VVWRVFILLIRVVILLFTEMKTKLILLFFSTLVLSCRNSANQEASAMREKDTLADTDKAFSRMSETKGMSDAFIYYASDDVIKLQDENYPIIGKKELKAALGSSRQKNARLTWEIIKVDVAASADLGYTFGNWKYTMQKSNGEDTTIYGNYVSIWKKQADGTWKFVLDGGNTTPPPKNIQS